MNKNNWKLFKKPRILNQNKCVYVAQTDLSHWRLKVICCKFAALSNKGNKTSHNLLTKGTVFKLSSLSSVQDQTLNCLKFWILMTIKKMKASNFYEKKKPTKCKYYIHLLFFIYSFVYISLLLFCLFSVVHYTQKFNLKLTPLIALVMSFRAGKMWLFSSKPEVNMVFSWAGSSTFLLLSSFHDFWFLLF